MIVGAHAVFYYAMTVIQWRPSRETSRVMRKPTFWFLTRSDTNQTVQLQKMTRGLKFRIKKVGGLYYLYSENKGADQLRGYREADLRLCFRICKMLVFSLCGSNPVFIVNLRGKTQAVLMNCAA